MHTNTQQKGFTLIELLVVIAIIGLLSSVILASLNGARIKSRDARRLADLKSLQTALELYYDSQSSPAYPTTSSGGTTVASALTGIVPTYMQSLPTDPSRNSTVPYKYCSIDGQGYALIASLEKSGTTYCVVASGSGSNVCDWDTTYSICR